MYRMSPAAITPIALLFNLTLFSGTSCFAALNTYFGSVDTGTNIRGTFMADVDSNPFTVLNFDPPNQTAGTLIGGNSLSGISFSTGVGGVPLQIVNIQPTTSGANAVGSDRESFIDVNYTNTGPNLLRMGDVITFSFESPVIGFGLNVTTYGNPQLNQLVLTAAGGVEPAAYNGTPIDVTNSWFFGLLSPDGATFSSATLTTQTGEGFFTFTMDDLVTVQNSTAVPEPSSIFLAAILVAIALGSRYRTP